MRQENHHKIEQLTKEKESLRKFKDEEILRLTVESEEQRKRYDH
jgi:hypothetical protein